MCVCEYVSVYTSVCAPSFPFPTGYWWGPSQRVWVEQSNLEEDSKSFVQSSWSDLSFFVSSRCNRSRTTALSEEPPSVSDIDLPMALGLSDALVTWWGTQALRRRRQNSGPRTFSTCHLWVVDTWPGLATCTCLCQESSPANGPSTDSEVLAWPSVLLHGFWGLGSDSCERVSCLAPSTDRKAPEIGATISIVSLLNFLFLKNWKPSEKLQEYYRELPYTLHLDFPIVKHVLYLLHLFLSTL